MSFHPHRFDPFDPLFAFPSAPSCPVASSSLYHHRESALFSPPPFPFHHLPSSHAFDHFSSDLDLFAPPPVSACPYFNSSSLDLFDLDDRFSSLELGARSRCPALKDRFSSLELGARGHCPALKDRFSSLELAARHCPAFKRDVKHTWTTEIKGDRKYKWVAETKNGERQYEYEAEVESPWENGFDRKLKWKAESDGKVKWSKEVKGKGCHEQWAHKYTCEDSLYGDWWKKCHKKECLEPWAHKYICEDSLHGDWLKKCHKKDKCKEGKKEEKKEEKKEKKEKHSVKVVEIEDSTDACDAIRKAFHSCCYKGKRKELSPQDAAMMIQMSYRAHLARRSQVLRCLRKMAVAKARLKEIRDLFYSFAYRRRVACDAAEQQTFTQKIKVLLLTVQELEGPDYMVRVAKKSMIEELEAMLEVVDPQPQGSHSSLSKRCRFDLPEGPISEELHSGVSEAVCIIEKED